MTVKVFLLDDHEIVRRGLRELLEMEPDIEVVGESGSAQEATRRIPALRPHVALLDARLPDGSGLDVCRDVRSVDPSIQGLILTSFNDEDALATAILAGAAGYLLKDADMAELELALKAVMRGAIYLSPSVSRQVVAGYIQHAGDAAAALDRLSTRQRETLRLIAEGHTTQDIAQRLGISAKTVEKHRAQLMERLGIHDVAGLVRYAIRIGLVAPE